MRALHPYDTTMSQSRRRIMVSQPIKKVSNDTRSDSVSWRSKSTPYSSMKRAPENEPLPWWSRIEPTTTTRETQRPLSITQTTTPARVLTNKEASRYHNVKIPTFLVIPIKKHVYENGVKPEITVDGLIFVYRMPQKHPKPLPSPKQCRLSHLTTSLRRLIVSHIDMKDLRRTLEYSKSQEELAQILDIMGYIKISGNATTSSHIAYESHITERLHSCKIYV